MTEGFRDPIPPGHGEPENVGARPGDYCSCGRPLGDCRVVARCSGCGAEAVSHGGAPAYLTHREGCPRDGFGRFG